jgi:Cdc6-like AAA superfamily ATPase
VNTSPFSLARFEYEHTHLYFLQRKLFDRLEVERPVYLIGSRGTGKTTLLKALSWSEQRNNKSLKQQLRGHSGTYVGIYLKLPEIQLALISEWAAERPPVHANIFAHYIDLVWTEQLLRAVADLIAQGHFLVGAEAEQSRVKEMLLATSLEPKDQHLRAPRTLLELSQFLRDRREQMELSASMGDPLNQTIERLNLTSHIGAFGRAIAQHLATLCWPLSDKNLSPGSFKICMDEGECLDKRQLLVMNTMVRLSRAPVFFVVSFVSPPEDSTRTLLPNLTLQMADRELVPLDEINEADFRDLVEGVATVRVRHALADPDAMFCAARSLGVLDINALLKDILRESVSANARRLLRDAAAAAEGANSDDLPIYETYLEQQLGTSASEPDSSWERRRDASAGSRKKFVAAYLSICHDVGARPRYAFAEMVLQLSDNCVRDFLAQIDEIFKESSDELSVFLSRAVDTKMQDKALRSSSQKKYESLPAFGVNNPDETRALVDGLGQLTAMLQRQSANSRHLRSSERGLFEIKIGEHPPDGLVRLSRSLREAAEAGFLRIASDDGDSLVVRVHTSLAARFGFSYRGAYYHVPMDWHALDHMRSLNDPKALESYVSQCYRGIERSDTQVDLFQDSGHD